MTLPTSIQESLKELLSCSTLQIFTKSEWGSSNHGHRELMRTEISALISDPTLHTSISHCPRLGTFVAAPLPLGVDVEIFTRVEDRIVARVSTAQEMSEAPSAAALWCAKEAGFKALRAFNQPSVISRISIGDWKKIDSQVETYRLLNPDDFNSPSENRGAVIRLGEFIFAFFIFHS